MSIIGLDISATRTGFTAIHEGEPGLKPTVICGSWQLAGPDFDDNCRLLSGRLVKLVRDLRARGMHPTSAGIEDVLRRLITKNERGEDGVEREKLVSNPHTMIVLPAMVGAAVAVLAAFDIPTTLYAASSWRKTFIGVGRTPVTVRRDLRRNWIKARVRMRAEGLGELWSFKVPDEDASESVGVAVHHMIQTNRGVRLHRGFIAVGGRP